jgi:hypothetical protein
MTTRASIRLLLVQSRVHRAHGVRLGRRALLVPAAQLDPSALQDQPAHLVQLALLALKPMGPWVRLVSMASTAQMEHRAQSVLLVLPVQME